MTTRRWQPTDPFEAGGTWWRVLPGRKGPNDLRLEWRVTGAWRPVLMESGLLMADFFYDNEDALFPPPFGSGGGKYMSALHRAVRHGWVDVAARLAADREARRIQQERDLDDNGWFR